MQKILHFKSIVVKTNKYRIKIKLESNETLNWRTSILGQERFKGCLVELS